MLPSASAAAGQPSASAVVGIGPAVVGIGLVDVPPWVVVASSLAVADLASVPAVSACTLVVLVVGCQDKPS